MRYVFLDMDCLDFQGWRCGETAPRARLAELGSAAGRNLHDPFALDEPLTRAEAQAPTERIQRSSPYGVLLILIACCAVGLGGAAAGGEAMATAAVPDVVAADEGIRLKDLCEIYGVRDNQLHGIGVVVGLSGTGDKTPATVRMLRQMLATKHLSFSDGDLESKNVAMVAVTADLPAFARNGSRLFTQVSCLGDASSLKGGVLLQTPLVAADERIYAVAQGSVSVGGFGAAGPNLVLGGVDHKNIETVANLAGGALVEREVPVSLLYGDRLRLVLREADFTTASRVAKALGEVFGPARVIAEDATMITLGFAAPPSETDLVDTIAKLQQLRVAPDLKARVVINSRTGTVVAGSQVRISAVAVSHGGLSLRVTPVLERRADPNDRSKVIEGMAWIDPVTRLRSPLPPAGTRPTTNPGTMNVIAGATVDDIANALNALGARPRDLVAIFEAIQRAGALHAELVVM
jgi:flagellar P-ring protein precursor FlgI